MTEISQKIFCAFCRLERSVIVKKHSDWTNVVLALMTAALLTFATWHDLDPRGVIFFVIAIVVSEIFVHFRWRLGMPCPHCSFDPVLYKTDRDLAAKKVKLRLAEVKASGQHLLRQNNPFLTLPKMKKNDDLEIKRAIEQRQVGRVLSREV